MASRKSKAATPQPELAKAPTGITGFDEITGGGLPKGRPTLICGGAGSGKTLIAMEFLVRGATRFNEPGLFVSFEETAPELIQNVASLGFKLDELIEREKMAIDNIFLERSQIEITGEYDLEGLFIRMGYMIDSIGAKRVVLDTIEALFASLPNEAILRAELRRLFRWLKEKGVTAIITAERGKEGNLTRHGLEEYVSDCVIVLDHRVTEQVSTRRLRIAKYRGTVHGTNEYPFLIEEDGISIVPITSIALDHKVSSERISTGVDSLDAMLGGGYYKISSILVSGTAGTGKSSLGASLAASVCRSGKRCIIMAFEESESQILRNMRSIGLDLQPYVEKGLLRFHASRPSAYGLEVHLVTLYSLITDFNPEAVIMDPITNMTNVGTKREVNSMLNRLIDFLKGKGITALFTSLAHPDSLEVTDMEISSLIDAWILLRTVETYGERNRIFHILKSRGMAHSNQVREFLITDNGIQLKDVYVGEGQVFTGSARTAQESRDKVESSARKQAIEVRQRDFERKREMISAQIETLKIQLEQEEDELRVALSRVELQEADREAGRKQLFDMRKVRPDSAKTEKRRKR